MAQTYMESYFSHMVSQVCSLPITREQTKHTQYFIVILLLNPFNLRPFIRLNNCITVTKYILHLHLLKDFEHTHIKKPFSLSKLYLETSIILYCFHIIIMEFNFSIEYVFQISPSIKQESDKCGFSLDNDIKETEYYIETQYSTLHCLRFFSLNYSIHVVR